MHFQRVLTTFLTSTSPSGTTTTTYITSHITSSQQRRSSYTNMSTSSIFSRIKNSSYTKSNHQHSNPFKKVIMSLQRGGALFSTSTSASLSPSEIAAEEARNAAKLFGFNEFESYLTTGGDDRSLILEKTGANKYHIKPQAIDASHIFRGSCTGNPPTTRGYEAAKQLYHNKLENLQGSELDSVLRDIFSNQRSRLSNVLKLPPGSEIILCPSGSDAEYIPIALAMMLKPSNALLKNGVTQLNEIGAGTAPAAIGEYFSTHAPFIGKLNGLKKLQGFDGIIEGCIVPARTREGDVVDASLKMKEFTDECVKNGHYPIVHGVFGGKTGVRDGVMPPSLNGADTSLGVVDACQGRFSLNELKEWLDQDSLVLFTTSKFYQAPPFCGAVIIPSTIVEKLSKCSTPPVEMLVNNGLGAYLTDKELPDCLHSWKPLLKDERKNNVGLALRWEAGLVAMEKLSSVDDEKRAKIVDEWANAVVAMVDKEPQLEAWCVERSIVSIRMSNNNGGWLSMDECKDLFRWMSIDISSAVPDCTDEEKAALSTIAYTGQPVSVSESHAIVRIALGVESLLSYIDNKDSTLQEDQRTVKKMAAISKYFSILKASGK